MNTRAATFALMASTSLGLFSNATHALGNHPSAGACPAEKPYYAICTHSLHNLEGWYSRVCRATPAEAQQDADRHARDEHNGNSRWTGIKKME